jgi:serine/threonine protein kinase
LSFLSLLEETPISNINGKTSVLMTHFSKEAKFQNEAYDATYELGESVVPACISPAYYDLFVNKDVINPTFANLLDRTVDTDGYLEYLSDLAKSRHVLQFGLILMEYAEGFRTLDEINRDKTLNEEQHIRARMLARMSHLLLHDKGILQGDSHEQNVMVNLDYQGFLTGTGKALVIDFGRARRLSGKLSAKKDEILNLINKYNLYLYTTIY